MPFTNPRSCEQEAEKKNNLWNEIEISEEIGDTWKIRNLQVDR